MQAMQLEFASDHQVRALTTGELIGGAFKIYRNQLITYLLVTALLVLPNLLLEPLTFYCVSGRFGAIGRTGTPAQILEDCWAVGLWFLFSIPLSLLQNAAFITAAASTCQGKPINFQGAVVAACQRLPCMLGVNFVAKLSIMLGTVAFIIPGILLALSYEFTSQVVMIEGCGVSAALSRSRALARGRYSRILALGLAMTLPLLMFHWALAAVLPESLVSIPVLGTVLKRLPVELLAPLYPTALTLAYFDARVRSGLCRA